MTSLLLIAFLLYGAHFLAEDDDARRIRHLKRARADLRRAFDATNRNTRRPL